MDIAAIQPQAVHYFLQGGGELGELTRAYDWASTSLDSPDNWPQSLQTTLSIILSSKFPMFLWWGDDLIQFYNDAYRPSLGREGKHPMALGQKGVDCWPEIWDIIYPLIEQVKTTGEPTWSEDQLLPIYRNGKLEDVYWTFSYSAVKGDSGKVEGVLVVCNETTEKVKMINKVEETEQRVRSVILSSPSPMAVYIGREMRIEMANQSIKDIWGKGNEVIGDTYYNLLPELESQNIYPVLDAVFTSGQPFHAYNQPLMLMVEGQPRQFYFDYSFTPLFDRDGNVYGVLNSANDVTDLNIAKQQVEESEQNLRNMILQAPVAMCILMETTIR